MYDPKSIRYPYPKRTDEHYLIVKKNDGTVFDENYPYIDKSKKFLRKQAFTRFLLNLIVFPVAHIRLGLKIKGKSILKKNKDLIKKGVISVCNHVHMWDYIAIMSAINPIKPYVVVWAPNVSGELGSMVRSVGGIPIPKQEPKATNAYLADIKELLDNGGWLHIYPEGAMWEYYQPIRPFKTGAAYFAIKFNKPVIPFAISYRKPSWFRRVFFKQEGVFTLSIGEPIFANNNLSFSEAKDELTIRLHEAVCSLAGMKQEENIYPPIFNNSERIDYYASEYGLNYKGSK